MGAEDWERTTFSGAEQAQARVLAGLTPDERVELLEQLLELAEESGALRRSREDKQRALDVLWAS